MDTKERLAVLRQRRQEASGQLATLSAQLQQLQTAICNIDGALALLEEIESEKEAEKKEEKK